MMNPFKTKKGLGRGLSSLIGDTDTKIVINKVSVSSLIRNKFQPRKNFNEESLKELTDSIRERGVIQPIIVRRSKDETDKYEIIAGERRWLASQNAGLHEVPIVEIEADDLKSLELAIVENVQRKDLNPIEEAKGYERLINEFYYDQEKVSKFIGKSRSHIANSLRLLSLPSEVVSLIERGKLSQGHAKVLVGMDNAKFLATKIVDKKMSVRQAENLIRFLKNKPLKRVDNKDPNILSLEKNLAEKTGITAIIQNKKNNSGYIKFEYKDIDQLNRLIEVLKVNY